jgi:hypothetical protein
MEAVFLNHLREYYLVQAKLFKNMFGKQRHQQLHASEYNKEFHP